MLNLELLEKVRDVILLEPEKHDQSAWMSPGDTDGARITCPTTACVAGWACHFAGDVGITVLNKRRLLEVDNVLTTDGGIYPVESRAANLLGISYSNYLGNDWYVYDVDYLFESDRTRQEVLDSLDILITEAKEQRNVVQ